MDGWIGELYEYKVVKFIRFVRRFVTFVVFFYLTNSFRLSDAIFESNS